MPAKRITSQQITGQRGVNLIEGHVLAMGCVWHATGALEAGIDGFIEIRDPTTGEVTNQIIQVQSKATERPFDKETATRFEYRCEARDIDYWLGGNAPVILIVSRPDTSEAYWKSLRTWFGDPAVRASRVVVFDKETDRFSPECRSALARLSANRDSGLYLPSIPRQERLRTNLLEVDFGAEFVHRAPSLFPDSRGAWAAFDAAKVRDPGGWYIKGGMVISFHDLRDKLWSSICDQGCVESDPIETWSDTEDDERERDFVRLLNALLKQQLYPKVLHRLDKGHVYYFRPSRDLRPVKVGFGGRKRASSMTVFKGYPSKKDPHRMSYYRSHSFKGTFRRFEDRWFLEIIPAYLFTIDGKKESRYAADLMSGIKRLDKHEAVLGQLLMWADYLAPPRDLLSPGTRYLRFGKLLEFDAEVGVDDRGWKAVEAEAGEEPEEGAVVGALFQSLGATGK